MPYLISAAYTVLNLYLGVRIFTFFKLLGLHISAVLFTAIYILLALSFILDMLLPCCRIKRIVTPVGYYFTGFSCCIFVGVVLADIVRFILVGTGAVTINKLTSRPILYISGSALILISAFLVIFAIINSNRLKISHYDININKPLPDGKLRIAMISDVHLGYTIGCRRIKRICSRLNKMSPDLLFIAGDLFDLDYRAVNHPDRISAMLHDVHTKYGAFACMGNHDSGKTWDDMVAFYERTGIKLLLDENINIPECVSVTGRLDKKPRMEHKSESRPLCEFTSGADRSLPYIIVDHQPSRLDEALDDGADLLLCGHTHAGQIFPGNLITRRLYEISWGYLKKESLNVVVSSGAATWGPSMRLGSYSEIVEINLLPIDK